VVQHEKARAVLMGQWGFGAKGDLSGTVCLFSGPPGERLNYPSWNCIDVGTAMMRVP